MGEVVFGDESVNVNVRLVVRGKKRKGWIVEGFYFGDGGVGW